MRFEWWRRAVVVERRRWPLPLWTRSFQVEEVSGARVDLRGWTRRKTYRVVLTLRSGETVPVLDGWSNGTRLPDAAAEAISMALLGQR